MQFAIRYRKDMSRCIGDRPVGLSNDKTAREDQSTNSEEMPVPAFTGTRIEFLR